MLGTPGLAADSALEPPPLDRYVRWGPFRVRPGLELRNVGYDDNVFSSNAAPQSDYTATLSPRVDGLLLVGDRAFVTFLERLDFTVYREFSDQNFIDQRGEARFTLPVRRLGFFVEGLLNRVKERPVDQQDIRTDRDEDGLGVGVILQPGWRTEVELARSRKSWSYFDEDADPAALETVGDRLDRSADRDRLEVRYRILGRTRLTLEAYRDVIEFDSATSSSRNSREWGVAPGVDFGEGGRLSGSLSVGWAEIEADDPTQPAFDDVVGRVRLVYRPSSRLSLLLDGVREPGFRVSGDSVFFLHTRSRVRGVYYFNRIVGIETGGSVGRLEFPGASVDRKDRVSGIEGGVRFRLAADSRGRRIEYSVRVERKDQDSTDPSQDRRRTTIGVGAVVGF